MREWVALERERTFIRSKNICDALACSCSCMLQISPSPLRLSSQESQPRTSERIPESRMGVGEKDRKKICHIFIFFFQAPKIGWLSYMRATNTNAHTFESCAKISFLLNICMVPYHTYDTVEVIKMGVTS